MLTQEQKQDYYGRAVTGLAGQEFAQSMSVDPKTGKAYGCAYVGAGCTRCAVGHLIPDVEALPRNIRQGGRRFDIVLPLVGVEYEPEGGRNLSDDPAPGYEDTFEFFQGLQTAHDNAEGPGDMKNRLNEFGLKWGLEIPAVLLDD